jgi:hypothetical protein
MSERSHQGEAIAVGWYFDRGDDGLLGIRDGVVHLPRPRAEMTDEDALDAYREVLRSDGVHLTGFAHRDFAAIVYRRILEAPDA